MTSTPSPPLSITSEYENDIYIAEINDLRESVYCLRTEVDKCIHELGDIRNLIYLYGTTTAVAIGFFMGIF